MITKEQLMNVLQQLYDGKPVAFSKIKRKVRESPETIEELLTELEGEGLIKRYDVGGGKAYEPVKSDPTAQILYMLKEIKEELKRLEVLVTDKNRIDFSIFDKIYDEVKDNLGYASLQSIRIELGLSREEFYSRFKNHIESNYDLIAGGEEGLMKKGVVYGIIKKRGNGK
ncbi:hypothetical protein [Stygiolobus caldivivus]|uniref:Uncharacterized protein n=1 Tax=Stygiolobus caldivivus TaxID=2824673 RepID=A0A8D5U707_9CREN|nr:hypothetical protein [Stygiolobus caldivivus]BCU70855.1 hypothetical protein KN1_21520 [Stygiolobus caldivivus]